MKLNNRNMNWSKWIFSFSLLILTAFSVNAQNNAIDKYYQSYSEDDRFTKISISSKMFSLFTNFDMEDEAEQEVVETISKLKGLKMLVGNELENAKSIYQDALRVANNMEELMTIEDKEQELIFYISESGGMISELLMLSYETDQVIMLSLIGDIDLKDISSLSNKMDIKGFDQLDNLENQ